jgi:hypothetical protein
MTVTQIEWQDKGAGARGAGVAAIDFALTDGLGVPGDATGTWPAPYALDLLVGRSVGSERLKVPACRPVSIGSGALVRKSA